MKYIMTLILPGMIVAYSFSFSLDLSTIYGKTGNMILFLLVSLLFGSIISAIRYFTIDKYLSWAFPPPKLDFSKLHGNLIEFQSVVDNHYNYYLHYSNLVIAFYMMIFYFSPIWYDTCNIQNFIIFSIAQIALSNAGVDCWKKYWKRSEEVFSREVE